MALGLPIIPASVDQALMVAGSSAIVVGDPCRKKQLALIRSQPLVDPTHEPVGVKLLPSSYDANTALYLGTSQLFSCCWAPPARYLPLQHVSSAARFALVYQRVDLEP